MVAHCCLIGHSPIGFCGVILISTGLIVPVLESYLYITLGDKDTQSHHIFALIIATWLYQSTIFLTFSLTSFALSHNFLDHHHFL
jgi:ABC-type Co2+ transport system permease subunit